MYYFRIEKLRHSSRAAEVFFATFVLKSCDFEAGAAKVYFVHYFCDECSENSPAKVPRWGPRKLFFCSRRWRFPEQGISDNCHTHTYIHIHMHRKNNTYRHILHYTTLHYITLHYTTLRYITYIQYIHTLHTYTHTYTQIQYKTIQNNAVQYNTVHTYIHEYFAYIRTHTYKHAYITDIHTYMHAGSTLHYIT